MSLYLSRLILNPRSPAVRRDLADCHALHARILGGFPREAGIQGQARERFGILFRLETQPRSGIPQLLVQSAVEPDWSHLPDDYLLPGDPLAGEANPDSKRIDQRYAALAPGAEYIFRLRANPTRRLASEPPGSGRPGKRVELRTEEELHWWLGRKAADGGFAVLTVRARADEGAARLAAIYAEAPPAAGLVPDVRATPGNKVTGWKEGRTTKLVFGSILFEGRLRVTDAEAFRGTLARGIGSGKAYGFGLLSIAPAL